MANKQKEWRIININSGCYECLRCGTKEPALLMNMSIPIMQELMEIFYDEHMDCKDNAPQAVSEQEMLADPITYGGPEL